MDVSKIKAFWVKYHVGVYCLGCFIAGQVAAFKFHV